MDYLQEREMFEKWYNENKARLHNLKMIEKVYAGYVAGSEAAQQSVQSDGLFRPHYHEFVDGVCWCGEKATSTSSR